jgi:hypothetical protein
VEVEEIVFCATYDYLFVAHFFANTTHQLASLAWLTGWMAFDTIREFGYTLLLVHGLHFVRLVIMAGVT